MAHEKPLLDKSPRTPPPPYSDPSIMTNVNAASSPFPTPTPAQIDPTRFTSSVREIPDEDARLVYVGDPVRTNDGFEFSGNSIRTAKYSVVSFLPRNLFEQFHRVAYVYFLVIAVLNQLPMLAVFGRGASILPLTFVLLVTLVKDGYEDWRRHRSDRCENNRTSLVFFDGEFQPKRWKEIRVGEVIKVCANETLPCDMVLLSTSDPTGVAYVQTINLDGESNLKTRYAKQETLVRERENGGFAGLIRCEIPNRNIYGFMGNIEIDGKRASLGPLNIVLRGCELKNTNWAVGVAVYAGNDTKVMLNSAGSSTKRSRLETHMNRETISLSVILFILCLVISSLHGIWLGNHRDELNIAPFYRKESFFGDDKGKNFNYFGIGLEIFFTFLKSVIVFQIMIPISLYISMELVRLGQAYFMIRDGNLYDEASNSRFQCRALNINEDLGQIKYVFSDKTGTLTENKMEFQCASIGGIDYSNGNIASDDSTDSHVVVDGQVWRPKMMVKTDPEVLRILNTEKNTERWHYTHDFFLALAACNTIVPLAVETPDSSAKVIEYQGESPDEQALVYAAAAHGFMLTERTSGHITISILGNRKTFSIQGLHEFDSDRKRMSVIVGCPDGAVMLFVKGADSSMLSVLDNSFNQDVAVETNNHLRRYSSLGLRTLVIGKRKLSSSEFKEWKLAYDNASTTLLGRANLLRSVAVNVETNLQLLGASGIEDKLQQGVPEAIESLRRAGIKIWVLTGDKQETAISIGYSCKLLTEEMVQIVINSHSRESSETCLRDAAAVSREFITREQNGTRPIRQARSSLALIIDGNSLVYILDSELEEELFEVATACDVVLCCRVAPLQKAGIVALIKDRTDDMTLAIGDGANDVSMIQMADVGIGISGQEGRQAVMASDFAMGQFRFLVPVLLVHGHWNYQRMAYMILYNFYRNSVFVFMLFWYVLYTAFTLTTAVTDWSSVLFSIIYTALPTIVVGILDKDLKRRTLLQYPQLYGAGPKEETYNMKLFLLTMMDSIWQSLAVFYIPYLSYTHSTIDGSSLGDLFTLAVVIMVNIHLAMDVYRWNWIVHAATWGCIVATAICIIVIDCFYFLPGYWAMINIMGTSLFWLCLFAILVAGMIPRFTMKVLREYFSPNDIQIARELEKFGDLNHVWTSEVELNTFRNTQQSTR